jgi:hypothetical protein
MDFANYFILVIDWIELRYLMLNDFATCEVTLIYTHSKSVLAHLRIGITWSLTPRGWTRSYRSCSAFTAVSSPNGGSQALNLCNSQDSHFSEPIIGRFGSERCECENRKQNSLESEFPKKNRPKDEARSDRWARSGNRERILHTWPNASNLEAAPTRIVLQLFVAHTNLTSSQTLVFISIVY